jgi:phospholipid-binding lipoprotein MlaA
MAKGANRWIAVASLGLAVLISGCATNPTDPNDPLEPLNRDFDAANNYLDRTILSPVVTAYIDTVPNGMRDGVSNFFDNLDEPHNLLNDLLQGKFGDAFTDGGRFIINSTVGIAGLFDVATPIGLERNDEDFGQTLGVWGADAGAYLVLPGLGPSSARDVWDLPMSLLTDPFTYVELGLGILPLRAMSVVDARARLDSAIRLRDESALDSYIFTREAYRQSRRDKVYDGDPPDDAFDNLEKSSSNVFGKFNPYNVMANN